MSLRVERWRSAIQPYTCTGKRRCVDRQGVGRVYQETRMGGAATEVGEAGGGWVFVGPHWVHGERALLF